MNKINLFFAIDDNYCPFLSSSVYSILKNANKNFIYDIYVLHHGMSNENKEIITNQIKNTASIEFVNMLEFVDMKEKLDILADKLVTRDYYTKTTYYRLFIPNMYPNLDKALYLDSDIIVTGDIAELYNTDLENNLVGAIPDMAVQNTPVFIDYVENALGVKSQNYFNAGILLMNLKEMRSWNFEEKFIDLLCKYSFRVAQDQDYLNVLTKDRVKYIDNSWNVQPVPNNICKVDKINLIHYNMLWKPWIFEGIDYSDIFWEYAKQCPMYENILKIKESITDECRNAKLQGGGALLDMCAVEAKDPNNYKNKFGV